MRAHQPGSTPIDIPETVPNPAYTPAPAPAPERAPTKVPEKVPEKVIELGVIRGVFLSAVNAAERTQPAREALRTPPYDVQVDRTGRVDALGEWLGALRDSATAIVSRVTKIELGERNASEQTFPCNHRGR